jgi:hypothetical protein
MGVTTGDKIKVGPQLIEVVGVAPRVITLRVDGGKPIIISEEERVKLAPDVFVSVGVGGSNRAAKHSHRLAMEAPSHISISRVPSA